MSNNETFWNLPLATLLSELDARVDGLSDLDVMRRVGRYGPNVLRPPHQLTLFRQILNRFANPLVLILLVASGVSALSGDAASFIIVTVIVLLSVTLDFIQEYQAGNAANALRQSVATRATALRNGNKQEIAFTGLVPGDVVLLSAGDLIPADARLLDAKDFFVNQSLLTGEPFPVEKRAHDLPTAVAGIGEADNAVFMGSAVVSGTARALICRTGTACAVGDIAQSLERQTPPTAFEHGTRRFGMLIMRLTILLVLFVLMVNAFFHRPLLDSFLFAVALAVGLTPELLPMIVTVTLARGALRMSTKSVIIKRLAAIHNLGSMDVLCTDKTGTLTEAHIRLERHVDIDGRDNRQVLELAYLNSYFETGLKSPLDDAILEHKEIDVSAWRKLDEVPFDFERRRVSVLAEAGGKRLLVVKGAPEDILRLSTHYSADWQRQPLPLDDTARAHADSLCANLGNDGFRVLGIAWRRVAPDHSHAVVTDETELVFAGFTAFLDPPKSDAARALRSLTDRGIAVKIVTGDNELVTQHVCRTLGIPIVGVITGETLQQLDDASLQARLDSTNLFCRVTPNQKNRIILTLKARGHTVGYMGDGINDAPSLHSADIGISVASAVDVAREAADMILLKQDLSVLHDGVTEGRRTFGNIMKYIMMGTSSNFGNMISMAGASLFLPFLPMLPVQILLNNLLYDISEIPIPMDHVDEEYLSQPRPWSMDFIRRFMWTVGPVSSAFDVLTFVIMLYVFQANEALFRTGWFIESIATQVLVIFVIRTRHPLWRSRPNGWLAATSLTVVIAAIAIPFLPIGAYFGFVAPPPLFFPLLVGTVLCYLLSVEVVKRRFFQH